MKRALICSLIATLTGVLPARADTQIVHVPVSFSVENVNQTGTGCRTTGGTYTLRGTLAAPAAGFSDAVTLYIAGGGDLDSWSIDAFPELDFIAAMARLGRTSVFVHALGYAPSDPVDGNDICFGSYATMTEQVIVHLRNGGYEAGGLPSAPEFERVAVVAHSGGVIATELHAVSFDSIDALGIVGWGDSATYQTSFYSDLIVPLAVDCAQGGTSKSDGGPGGWTTGPGEQFIRDISYNVAPAVLEHALEAWTGEPCGLGQDVGQAIALYVALSHTIEVPVLLLFGDHDPFLAGQYDGMRARFSGSDDVSLGIMPDTGHMMMVGNTMDAVAATMSGWLRPRGF